MADDQPWVRQPGERSNAYQAFRVYLELGKDRTIQRAADGHGMSHSMLKRWSIDHSWVARSAAFDSYTITAPLDGMVHALAETRDKNLALMDKLRGLLDMRLDDFISKREDPTIRWTQACVAMTKIEANSLMMGQQEKNSDRLERVEELLRKLDEETMA